MSYNPIQDKVDKLLKELNKRPDDDEKQPYSKNTIKTFLLEEIAALRESRTPEHIIAERKKLLMTEIERVYYMTKGELREYMATKDAQNIQAAKAYNERKIFEVCLKREIQARRIVGIAAATFERDRISAYENGTFDYQPELKKTMKIMIEHADVQMVDRVKTLKDEENIIKTEDRLNAIEAKENALVGDTSPNMVLKPKK